MQREMHKHQQQQLQQMELQLQKQQQQQQKQFHTLPPQPYSPYHSQTQSQSPHHHQSTLWQQQPQSPQSSLSYSFSQSPQMQHSPQPHSSPLSTQHIFHRAQPQPNMQHLHQFQPMSAFTQSPSSHFPPPSYSTPLPQHNYAPLPNMYNQMAPQQYPTPMGDNFIFHSTPTSPPHAAWNNDPRTSPTIPPNEPFKQEYMAPLPSQNTTDATNTIRP